MVDNVNRRQFIKAGSIGGIAALAGCAGVGGGGSREIKLGTVLPVSGKFGSIGSTMENAAKLAFTNVDDASDTLTISVTYGDSESSQQGAISASNSLTSAGIPAVVGPATTSNFLTAAKQVFIPAGTVMCTPSATATSITTLDDKNLAFRTVPSDAFQGNVMAKYATEEIGAKTASTLFINDAYGQGLANNFAESFKERGGTVQAQVPYTSGKASYTSQISQAVKNDPDLLTYIGKGGSTSIQLLKNYYSEFDPDRPILTVDGMNTARIPNEVGRPLKNVTGTTPLASGPARKTFDKMYQNEYDSPPGPFNGQTFDAAAIVMLANARAGENSGSAIKSEMRPVANPGNNVMKVTPENLTEGIEAASNGDAVNYQGAASPIKFDKNGDLVAATFGIWQYAPDTEQGYKVINEIKVSQ